MTQPISRRPDHATNPASPQNIAPETSVDTGTPTSGGTPSSPSPASASETAGDREQRDTNGDSGRGKLDASELLRRIAGRRARRRERIIAIIDKILDTWAEEDARGQQGDQRGREAGQDSIP